MNYWCMKNMDILACNAKEDAHGFMLMKDNYISVHMLRCMTKWSLSNNMNSTNEEFAKSNMEQKTSQILIGPSCAGPRPNWSHTQSKYNSVYAQCCPCQFSVRNTSSAI